jgi:hypothetical protein
MAVSASSTCLTVNSATRTRPIVPVNFATAHLCLAIVDGATSRTSRSNQSASNSATVNAAGAATGPFASNWFSRSRASRFVGADTRRLRPSMIAAPIHTPGRSLL